MKKISNNIKEEYMKQYARQLYVCYSETLNFKYIGYDRSYMWVSGKYRESVEETLKIYYDGYYYDKRGKGEY